MTLRDLSILSAILPLIACHGGDETDSDTTIDVADVASSVSSVLPNVVYPQRRLQVTVSGDNTDWDAATTVRFGDGIDVVRQIVASPTAIVADIDVSGTAALGPRDVTVVDGAETLVYGQAFEVRAPLEVTVRGDVAQGSLIVVDVIQRDPSAPFDTTQTCDLFGCRYTGVDAQFDLAGIDARLQVVGPNWLTLWALLDVNAETGASALVLDSGPPAARVTSVAPDALDVSTRGPKALVEGVNVGGVERAYGSELWSLDPTDATEVSLALTTDDVAAPELALLDHTGSFVDGFLALDSAFTFEPLPGEGPYYVIAWDASGDDAYDYAIEVSMSRPAPPEADDACGTVPTTTPVPSLGLAGSFNDADDQDWYRVTVDAGHVGQALRVVTRPGDAYTDTRVELYGRDACDSLTLAFQDDEDDLFDSEWHEDVVTPALDAAGDWYVVIRSNAYFYDPDETDYLLDLAWVAP